MSGFFEEYIIEVILFAGCLLAHPFAQLIAGYGSYDDDTRRRNDIKTIQLVVILLFGSLIVFSLLIS